MTDKLFDAILQANKQVRKTQQEYELHVMIRWLIILSVGGALLIQSLR